MSWDIIITLLIVTAMAIFGLKYLIGMFSGKNKALDCGHCPHYNKTGGCSMKSSHDDCTEHLVENNKGNNEKT